MNTLNIFVNTVRLASNKSIAEAKAAVVVVVVVVVLAAAAACKQSV